MASRLPGRLWIRFLLLAAVVVGAFVLFRFTLLGQVFEGDKLTAWLERVRGEPLAPVLLIGIYVIVCPIGAPVSPLVVAGAVVFGMWKGAAVNFIGLLLGATATYLLARWLGYEFVARIMGARHERLERLLGRHGFWSLVRIRFIPLPFVVANFGAALLGVRLPTFLASTALAFLPGVLIWSYFTSALVTVAEGDRSGVVRNMVIAILLMLCLTFVPSLVRVVRRRRRYRLLLEERRNRLADAPHKVG